MMVKIYDYFSNPVKRNVGSRYNGGKGELRGALAGRAQVRQSEFLTHRAAGKRSSSPVFLTKVSDVARTHLFGEGFRLPVYPFFPHSINGGLESLFGGAGFPSVGLELLNALVVEFDDLFSIQHSNKGGVIFIFYDGNSVKVADGKLF